MRGFLIGTGFVISQISGMMIILVASGPIWKTFAIEMINLLILFILVMVANQIKE